MQMIRLMCAALLDTYKVSLKSGIYQALNDAGTAYPHAAMALVQPMPEPPHPAPHTP